MPVRLKKLVGTVAILAFLLFYVGAAVAIADRLPDLWPVKLVFFLIVGAVWGAPLIPLISWMNRERDYKKPD